jgi:hypothetical protein
MSPRTLVIAVVLVIGLVSRSDAALINFDSNDGGFTASTLLMNPGGTGTPWTYVSGSQCWGGHGCWLVQDYANVSLQALTSPLYFATGPVALAFDESFNEESNGAAAFDGGVVEISVNGGEFTDVVSDYGAFSGQTYNKTMSIGWSNPLPGREVISGANAGGYGVFVTASITLPLSSGDQFQLRWVQGTDSASAASVPNGWIVDNVSLDFGSNGAAEVPEPRSLYLVVVGLALLMFGRKRAT